MKKKQSLAQKVNILRAAVMGANDGIISIAGIVVGVAGATSNSFAILVSGLAGMLAGTVSMAMGEYVSVNTQKDAQRQAVENEEQALKDNYQGEFDFIEQKYISTGMDADLAHKATQEMMTGDALGAGVRERYGFNSHEYTSPYDAAIASMIAFPTGSFFPLLAIWLFPQNVRVVATIVSVLLALVLTGYFAAVLSKSNRLRGVIRNVVSGLLTMLVTYYIGSLFA